MKSSKDSKHANQLMAKAEPDDLVRFGMIPEFIGRLPVCAILEELDETALMSILKEPKNALVKQYARLFTMEGVQLEIREDRSEEHTSELQSLMRISYAVFCLKKTTTKHKIQSEQ